MGSPKVILRQAVHISSTGVFLVPAEGETLDFQTVSSVPPAHRGFLQENGCIVKVMFSLSTVPTDVCTREGRLKIWWDALVSSGLVESDVLSVTVPAALCDTMWPIVDDKTFVSCMEAATKRHRDETLRECPFILPLLSVQEFSYRDRGIHGRLGAIWMPRYQRNLQEWSEMHFSQHFIPEATLGSLINQLTIGILALRAVNEMPSSCITLEDILVGGDEEKRKKPMFVLNALDCHLTQRLHNRSRKTSSLAEICAPELVQQSKKPLDNSRCDVWALGMIVYQVARGLLNLKDGATALRSGGSKPEEQLPLNHISMTPSDIAKCVRRDLRAGMYSSPFTHLVILMLGQDPLTRPTFRELDRILHDIFRHRPIFRFPFSVGSFHLIYLPSPERVVINTTTDKYLIEAKCLLCGKNRRSPKCIRGVHISASCSPLWLTDEPLPGCMVTTRTQMTYLYPIVGHLENKELRQHIETALNGEEIDINALFQLFGGFALLQMDEQRGLITCGVMVPIPCNVLQKKERCLVATKISFTAAMPWPSQCTSKLQQEGRIQRAVPAVFGISNVSWYAWILPGEKFQLNGKLWVPSPDGAFVFWFNDLLHPSEMDRYFILCGVASLTLQSKVDCNMLPDPCFNRVSVKSEENSQYHSQHEFPSMHSFKDEQGDHARIHCNKRRNALLRRSRIISFADLPEAVEVEELDVEWKPITRQKASEAAEANVPKASPYENLTNRQLRLSSKGAAPQMKCLDDFTSENVRYNLRNTFTTGSFSLQKKPNDIFADMNDVETQRHLENENEVIHPRFSPTKKNKSGYSATGTRDGYAQSPCAKGQPSKKRHTDSKMISIELPPKIPLITNSADAARIATATKDTRMLSYPENDVSHLAKTVTGMTTKFPLKIFGRWHQSWCIDAAFRSPTFFISETGEHGYLSIPVELSTTTRLSLNASKDAVSMAFCSNLIPNMQRNHPSYENFLSPGAVNGIIPHHGLVFYDRNEELVALLAFRFATTSYPDFTVGEILLQFTTLPPLPTTAFMASQLGASYFSGTALFDTSLPPKTVTDANEEEVLCYLPNANANSTWNRSLNASQLLTMSSVGLLSFHDCYASIPQNDGESLPFCWVGFDVSTRMLMLADEQQEVWHPLHLSAE